MTTHWHTYPALPLRLDLVGTPWWQTLVEEVAPKYAQLRRAFESATTLVVDGNSADIVRYESGHHTYTYYKRVAKSEAVQTLIQGVLDLQALLDEAAPSVGGGLYPSRLLIDLSLVTVQGDLRLPDVDWPELLCHRTVFEGDVDFSGAQFDAGACFDQATFKGNANFSNVRFGRFRSHFKRVVFCQRAWFFCTYGAALFDASVFVGYADFEGARFGSDDLTMEGVVIAGDSDFSD